MMDEVESANLIISEEKKKSINWRFYVYIGTILSVLFVGEASRGLVVPSLYLYIEQLGGSPQFLGIVVAIFSVGRLLGSIGFGYWYNWRGPREVMIASLMISFVGNILFATGYATSKWTVLVSRFLVGLGSGILSPVRAALVDVTTNDQRVRYMAISNAVQFIGFAIMPGVAILLTWIDFSVGSLRIDQCSSAGIILAVLDAIAFCGIYVLGASPDQHQNYKRERDIKEVKEEVPTKWVTFGVAVFISLNLITRGILALLETVGSPIFVKLWDFDNDPVEDSANMFLILGIFGLVVYVLLDYQRKWVSEHILLSASFFLTGMGAFFFIEWGHSSQSVGMFLTGATLIWSIASPIAQTLVLSTFSKILGKQPQGSAMGLIGSAGSIGRILFPLAAVILPANGSFIIAIITAWLGGAAVLWYNYKVTHAKATRYYELHDVTEQ